MPVVRALRDVSLGELERYREMLPEVAYRRSRHVISENARVQDARAALEHGDPESFGRLMRESHRSLKEDYEVSSAELDLLVEMARGMAGVYGSRMTGGGFGGCTISLVRSGAVEEFQSAIAHGYHQATGRKPDIYIVRASDGVREALE
jgi:galactokinase